MSPKLPNTRCLVVNLGPGVSAGPVSVLPEKDGLPLGAWLVRPGEPALIGLRSAGPVQVKWKLPDGRSGTKTVKAREAGPLRVTIGD